MKIFCGLFMTAALVGGFLIAFYAPHKPVFNICSTHFDWGSIAHSLKTLQVGLDWRMCCLLCGVCCGVRVLAGVKLTYIYIYFFSFPVCDVMSFILYSLY